MSRDDLTRWGRLLNGAGAALLLFFHFPYSVPSGWPEGITADAYSAPWWWANLIGSVAGVALTFAGIAYQHKAIGRRE
jgi:hypothetical protein